MNLFKGCDWKNDDLFKLRTPLEQHKILSYVKSFVRLVGYAALLAAFDPHVVHHDAVSLLAVMILAGAEIIGIAEEEYGA